MSLPADPVRDAIVDYVSAFTATHGYSPSTREIGEWVGLRSTSTVQAHVDRLVDEGRLTHVPGVPRTLRAVAQ